MNGLLVKRTQYHVQDVRVGWTTLRLGDMKMYDAYKEINKIWLILLGILVVWVLILVFG